VNDDRARDALTLAEAALAHAQREGVSEAEALVMADDSALTRFANSEIHQNVAETNISVNLRFVLGRRIGVASTGRTDADGLRRLVETAAAIARCRAGSRATSARRRSAHPRPGTCTRTGSSTPRRTSSAASSPGGGGG